MEIDLSKRPEGATHYAIQLEGLTVGQKEMNNQYPWRQYMHGAWYAFVGGDWIVVSDPEEARYVRIRDSSFERRIQEGIDDADAGRLKPLSEVKAKYVWNGEGLPPEGQLEYKSNDGWRLGECVAIRDGYAVIWVNCGNLFAVSEHDKGALRPIRTPEQIAADEKAEAIEEIAKVTGLRARDGRTEVAIAIYTAGYRKQVEE